MTRLAILIGLAMAVAVPRADAKCAGDCGADGVVTVSELITGVNIALGSAALDACPAFDSSGDGTVAINELIAAVNAALTGCPTG